MGLGVRTFVVEPDRLIRLPNARLQRLFDGDKGERLQEYAGRSIRCALVHINVVDRRPVSIVHLSCPTLRIDRHGRIDLKELGRAQRLAVASMTGWMHNTPRSAVRFDRYVAARRYKAEFTWTPTEAEVELLTGAVLKR